VRGGCGTSEVVDFIYFDIYWIDDVVLDDTETLEVPKKANVPLQAGREVVKTSDSMSRVQKTLAKMRSKKTGPAGNKNTPRPLRVDKPDIAKEIVGAMTDWNCTDAVQCIAPCLEFGRTGAVMRQLS
jgi:hypothetical protein